MVFILLLWLRGFCTSFYISHLMNVLISLSPPTFDVVDTHRYDTLLPTRINRVDFCDYGVFI